MSCPDPRATGGFGERPQEPFKPEDIPTETEAFLRWGTTLPPDHPFKYELSNGKVSRTMVKVSQAHWLVTTGVLQELLLKLDRTRFRAGPTEFGVRTGVGVRYPDVVVDCAGFRPASLAAEAPILAVEALSPSTAGLDFTAKQREYKGIASLQAYLICSQDEPRAWVWQREPDGTWPELPLELEGRDGKIALRALEIELAMAAIFQDIPDPPSIE
jgi:Uma2 family endonuclease